MSVEKDLNQVLFDEPYSFEFFQAVRLLEKIYPTRSAVGGTAMPADEVVRFRSHVGLEFPASEIQELETVETPNAADRVEMIVNFMGMAGVNGALPTHYTELVGDRIRHRDTAMWSFLDIFTHRAVSLFFRAWAKYRYPIGYERGEDRFTEYLYDLAGLGTRGLRGRLDVDDEALLPYTGMIAQMPHSANAIENIVSDHFGIRARVKQFAGQWLRLDRRDVTRLGTRNSRLSRSAIVGTRVWDQQSKFRLKLGPLTFRAFQAFLPSGTASKPLRSIVNFVVGREFDFDVQLILDKRQVPSTILTTRAIRRPALGWTTFLKTAPFAVDDEQVILQQPAAAGR